MATTHNLSDFTLLYGLIPISGGFGDGDVISWEQVSPDVVAKEGAAGDVVFCVTGKRLTKVTIKLQRTSPVNGILSTISNLQRAGAGPAPFLVADLGGVHFLEATEAMIEGPPKVAFGAEDGELEWAILCANPDRLDAGHP